MKSESRPFTLDLLDSFWSTVDEIRTKPDAAFDRLSLMSKSELEQFYYDYRKASIELYSEYADEERGLSEDAIARASAWVVSQGKDKYMEVWNDPSLLPNPYSLPYTDFSGLAAQVYYQRFGSELTG